MAIGDTVSDATSTVETGARELATVPTLLGVAAVLSSGAIITSYMGLFGGRTRLVRLTALGVFASSLVGYAATGASGFSGSMKSGVQAFTATLGLMAFAQMINDLLKGGMPKLELGAEEIVNEPSGDGSVIGQQTATQSFTPLAEDPTVNDLNMDRTTYRHEYDRVDYRDLGQFAPLDSHRSDIGHAPPVWMAETVPSVAQQPMVANASTITSTGVSDPAFNNWVLPSLMQGSASPSGHGVIQNWGADTMGNNLHAADGFGSVIGQ